VANTAELIIRIRDEVSGVGGSQPTSPLPIGAIPPPRDVRSTLTLARRGTRLIWFIRVSSG
jgi:hypothetical protein